MTQFSLANGGEVSAENLRLLLEWLNQIARFADFGSGAPTHTPTGPRLYFRFDGAAPGEMIYGWDSASWTGVV